MATDPVYPEAVEPDDFWDENKGKIITYAVLVLLALAGWGAYQWTSINKRNAARAAYADAKDAEALRAVISDYAGDVVAGDAALQLGNLLRQEGKYDEAVATLNEFLKAQPDHPLAGGAYLSLGATQELAGKPEEAFNAYAVAISRFPDGYSAPLALIAQARIRAKQGQKEEAIRLFREVETRFPDNTLAREAAQELRRVEREP